MEFRVQVRPIGYFFSAALFLIWGSGGTAYSEVLSPESLFRLNAPWANQRGETIRLEKFQGKPTVLAMAYTKCKYACPMLIKKLKKVESDIGKMDYNIVIASFDTKSETKEGLQKYVEKHELDPKRWSVLMSKSDSDVRKLAAVMGVNYKEDEDGEFSHSNVIVLLNEAGEIIQKVNGLSGDHSGLVTKIRSLKIN